GEVPLHAVLTHAVPDGRRAERLRGVVLLDGCDERGGIHLSRPGGVQIGNDDGYSHGYAEEGEERKGSEVHLAFLDAVEVAQFAYLCGEHPVLVHDAFGRACAAGGEQDCGCVTRVRRRTGTHLPGGFPNPGPVSPSTTCGCRVPRPGDSAPRRSDRIPR